MKTCLALSLILFFAVVGQSQTPRHRQTEADIEASAARLHVVVTQFKRWSDGPSPTLTWRSVAGRTIQQVLPVVPRRLDHPKYAVLRPFVEEAGDYYLANVSAEDDSSQQPIYLYLFSYRDHTAKLVVAFHLHDGQSERIAG